MRHELSRFLEGDLEAIAATIAATDSRKSVTFIQQIRQQMLLVAQQPQFHRPWPEVGPDAYLALACNTFILFRIVGSRVRFERIVWGGTEIPALFANM